MAWSTRELAELAGTSLRTVRHYHEIGLLAEPERRSNGYKQYGVAHLVRLVRIKRLTELGFSLSQIAAMGDTGDHPEQALRTLDAELAATIERLQRARVELGAILHRATPADLPPEFAPANGNAEVMTDADRSFILVMTRVLGPEGLQTYAEMLKDDLVDPAVSEFNDLPADADEPTRAAVAERLAPFVRKLFADHPGLGTVHSDAPRGPRFAQQTIAEALVDLYNPAQIDVLQRAGRHLETEPGPS
ncbi:helix-turn-helix domain-containing protein [Nocardia mexicana]|uniref:DNA-binding transcriptional MerR regulator n=1 Tax=Nocardia mexicana TaxID=279262 RepID=A0A370GZT4_9NOCA|nr:MerR family transcriptional regulator [Nocardia mexicana]RDI48174.1 DNA-binding transcriptional MerR regulator [Nocardia mexicana]